MIYDHSEHSDLGKERNDLLIALAKPAKSCPGNSVSDLEFLFDVLR